MYIVSYWVINFKNDNFLSYLIQVFNNKYFDTYCTSIKYQDGGRFLTHIIPFNPHNNL